MAKKADARTEVIEVFCRYIVKNGKRIYPKAAKCFHFFITKQKS